MYHYTILYVEDPRSTAEFYKKAFGFTIKFTTPEGDYAELDTGNTTLAFASFELGNSNLSGGYIASKPMQKPFGVELAFITEELEETLKKALEAGANAVEPITAKPWGQNVAYVQDPNGFLIELADPMQG